MNSKYKRGGNIQKSNYVRCARTCVTCVRVDRVVRAGARACAAHTFYVFIPDISTRTQNSKANLVMVSRGGDRELLKTRAHQAPTAPSRRKPFSFRFAAFSAFTWLPSDRLAYTCFLPRFTNPAGFEPRIPDVSHSAQVARSLPRLTHGGYVHLPALRRARRTIPARRRRASRALSTGWA